MPHPLAAFDLPWRQCGGILVAPAAFWRQNRGPGGVVAAFRVLAALGGPVACLAAARAPGAALDLGDRAAWSRRTGHARVCRSRSRRICVRPAPAEDPPALQALRGAHRRPRGPSLGYELETILLRWERIVTLWRAFSRSCRCRSRFVQLKKFGSSS